MTDVTAGHGVQSDGVQSEWAAPRATRPIDATVELPGSKSLTNRALILAALAEGPAQIRGTLRSRDTDLMIAGLAALGTGIAVDPDDPTTLSITPGTFHAATIDCGLAGTVMRFLPPVAALATGAVAFDGDPQARKRPMHTILGALRDLGVAVTGESLPFTVVGTGGVPGGPVTVDASASSQFVSGLLLSAPRFTDGVTITHQGAPVPSMPHIEMTVDMLEATGVEVTVGPDTWHVAPGPIEAIDWDIEPDLSNAAAFLAAAAITGGTVTVPRWPRVTTQPGAAIVDLLTAMGATASIAGGSLRLTGPQRLRALRADLRAVGELTPTLAALCAVADGESELSGIGHLRGHETDRLAALTTEINRLGGRAEETADGLRILGTALHGGLWHSYADHRMATAGAAIGLVTDDVMVEDIATTSKTMPDFPGMWDAMIGSR